MTEKFEQGAFGKLLTEYRRTREQARAQAIAELWKRNKLAPNDPGYKLAETPMVKKDGSEVTEYRLYKLIDAQVVTVGAEVTTQVEQGVSAVRENRGAKEFPQ
jgi:hypothetical protein